MPSCADALGDAEIADCSERREEHARQASYGLIVAGIGLASVVSVAR
jgi:hypothetical protein